MKIVSFLSINLHSEKTTLQKQPYIKLTDELLFNMDDDKVTGMISIDFKKAFDLVNHETLLQKLTSDVRP